MLKMFPSMSGKINGVDVGNLASKLENIQILSADEPNIIEQLRKDTKHISTKNGYEELLRVRDDGDKTTIYFKEKKKNSEFIMITDEGNEFTIISIVGNDISLKDIQDMTNRTVEDQ
jgi:type IV secretory pathway VirB9-like protein